MFETTKYLRKPLKVEAVCVTDDNMAELARWVRGQVITPPDTEEENGNRPHISVSVHNPVGDRYSKAFVGDYIVATKGQSFKVYPERAFLKNFDTDPDGGTVMHDMEAERKAKPRPKPGPRGIKNPVIDVAKMTPEQRDELRRQLDGPEEKKYFEAPRETKEFITGQGSVAYNNTMMTPEQMKKTPSIDDHPGALVEKDEVEE